MINIDQISKIFVSGAFISNNKEFFAFVLNSGDQQFGFATTPTQMKAIIEVFKKQMDNYEKQFGQVDISHGLIPSPISFKEPPKSNTGE